MRKILSYLFIISIVTALSSCNDTDDLTSIFTKNPKKMTMIFRKKGSTRVPILQDWSSENPEEAQAIEKCAQVAAEPGNYILSYDGSEEDGTIQGRFKFKLVTVTLEGKWGADGKKQTIWFQYDTPVNPNKGSDRLEREIIKVFTQVNKYSGDKNNQSLYYEMGNSPYHYYIGFQSY